jgi:hypothetical protein
MAGNQAEAGQLRREALRGKPNDAQEVDALLQLGQGIPFEKRQWPGPD